MWIWARCMLVLLLAVAGLGAQETAWRLKIRSGGQDLLVWEDGSLDRVLGAAPRGPEPFFSPDGKRRAELSFEADTAVIFVADAEGRDRHKLAASVFPGDAPSWSPDGNLLAFSSKQTGAWQIYVADLRQGRTDRISRDPEPAWKPRFLPDGRLAYLSGPAGPGQVRLADLLVASGGNVTVVLEKQNITGFAPSPDGRLLAVGIGPPNGRLVFADLKTARKSEVVFARDIDARLFSHGAFQLVWRPDSAAVACRVSFIGGRLQGAHIFGDSEVFVVRPNGRVTWFRTEAEQPVILGWSR